MTVWKTHRRLAALLKAKQITPTFFIREETRELLIAFDNEAQNGGWLVFKMGPTGKILSYQCISLEEQVTGFSPVSLSVFKLKQKLLPLGFGDLLP